MFTVKNRSRSWNQIADSEVDLLVIGGGITGAGIALDAQTRGLQTVLVEMQDFAAGTSSRSTKLVHGGLRYLKQLEFGLVAEVGRERAIVYQNAPHVTRPEWMLLPIVEGGTYGKWASSLGIWLYDVLAKVKKTERRKMLNVEQTLAKEPLLNRDVLKGSGYYVEYRTDDARLTIEVLKKAVEMGVHAFNYMKVVDFIYQNKKVKGVVVQDLLSGKQDRLFAKSIVNATGPWVDELREKDGSKTGKTIHWTKGVHIVVDQKRFPLSQAVYFDVSDGRMVFAIPREGKTYIGTTDTDYSESLTHPETTVQDRDYLLSAVNHMFPTIGLSAKDVESCWAGIRPLVHEEGKPPSEISRKDEIFHSDSGLITIAGGKLTGYRKMAERVVDLVLSTFFHRKEACQTERLVLSGGDVGGEKGFSDFLAVKVKQGILLGLEEKAVRRLVHRYGSNIDRIFQLIEQNREQAAQYGLSLEVIGELLYGLMYEMVATPVDFFVRRTGALFFAIDWVYQWNEPVMKFMSDYFKWSEEEYRENSRLLAQEIARATQV